jgi:hypothetical protein
MFFAVVVVIVGDFGSHGNPAAVLQVVLVMRFLGQHNQYLYVPFQRVS